MRPVLVAACALVLVAAATATAAPKPGDVRGCRTRGEGRHPQRLPHPAGVRIGPLVIWPSVRGRSSGPTSDPERPFVVKAPVVLPARTKVVLAVADPRLAAFQSTHRHEWVSVVRFEACRERTPAWAYRGTVGKLTGFPFAIGLRTRSACVPMELWIDGRAEPLRRVVPVGRRAC